MAISLQTSTNAGRSACLWWRTVRPLALSTAFVVAIAWIGVWSLIAALTLERWNFNDFGTFFYAARSWRAGGSLYDPSVTTWLQLRPGGVHLLNLNPPQLSMVFWPLSFLSVEYAFVVWCLVTVGCLALSLRLTGRELDLHLSFSAWFLWIAAALSASPSLSFLTTGNLTGPVTLLMTTTWVAWRKGRWTRVGLLLGVAWSSKVFFLPLVAYLALTRRWRAFVLALLTGFACLLVGAAVFGTSEIWRWTVALREVQWSWLSINSSIVAPFSRAAYVIRENRMTGSGGLWTIRFGTALSAAVALLGLAAARRARDPDRTFLLLLLTCLLASPLGWLYYWWMFVPPLIACAKRFPGVRRAVYWSTPGWLVMPHMIGPLSSVILVTTIGSVYCWSLVVLWIGALRAHEGTNVAQA